MKAINSLDYYSLILNNPPSAPDQIRKMKEKLPIQTEAKLHEAICTYIRLQYPDVIFTSEASGIRLPVGYAVKLKKLRSKHTLPDLWILAPRNGYHGLVIELKRQGERVYKKDGSYASEHISDQAETLDALNKDGYNAVFACGYEEAQEIVDEYLWQAVELANKIKR